MTSSPVTLHPLPHLGIIPLPAPWYRKVRPRLRIVVDLYGLRQLAAALAKEACFRRYLEKDSLVRTTWRIFGKTGEQAPRKKSGSKLPQSTRRGFEIVNLHRREICDTRAKKGKFLFTKQVHSPAGHGNSGGQAVIMSRNNPQGA